MFKLTQLIHFDAAATQAERDALAAALRSLEGCRFAQPTLPGNFNGGDLMAHFQFHDAASRLAAQSRLDAALAVPGVRHVDSAVYEGGSGQATEPRLQGGVYRALFLCVDRPVNASVIEQFEAETLAMPRYIPAIRNWQLSRVAEAGGAQPWTHVWEQEYAGIEGLTGPYMLHPYHWARIDRWFDPECPEWMVNTTLCHSFCALERSVIA